MATYRLIFRSGGDPQAATGLTPTFVKWRNADGTAAVAAPAIAEVSAANNPGLYAFTGSPTVPIYFIVDGGAGLPAGERYIDGIITPDDFALTEDRMAMLRLILALAAQKNFRILNPVHDVKGNMTAGTFKAYASSGDADLDANAIAALTLVATYDASGNLASYKVTG